MLAWKAARRKHQTYCWLSKSSSDMPALITQQPTQPPGVHNDLLYPEFFQNVNRLVWSRMAANHWSLRTTFLSIDEKKLGKETMLHGVSTRTIFPPPRF